MVCFTHKFKDAVTVFIVSTGSNKPPGRNAEMTEQLYVALMSCDTLPTPLPDNVIFTRFYQLDGIYDQYRDIIKKSVRNCELVLPSGDHGGETYKYELSRLLQPPLREYNFVIHLRLEDFVQHGMHIDVKYVLALLDSIPKAELNGSNAVVVNSIQTAFEQSYLEQVLAWFQQNSLSVTTESNNVYDDFNIIAHAQTVACSCSTLSWCAVMLSDTVIKCYFPNYRTRSCPAGNMQTFRTPIANTVLYEITE